MSENATRGYGPVGEPSATWTDVALGGGVLVATAGGLFGALPFEPAVLILLATIAIQQVR